MHEPMSPGVSAPLIEVRAGCEFRYACEFPAPLVVMVTPRSERDRYIVQERWDVTPWLPMRVGFDAFGNHLRRMVLPKGETVVRYDATISLVGLPDEADEGVVQTPVDELPDEVLAYLLPSRFCQSDRLLDEAWRLFGATQPGRQRVQAICDWVHDNVAFAYGSSDAFTSANDIFERREGVCRDFTQLAVTFCRALNVPARYAFGYLPDIGVPPPTMPMDFCAWMEVFLGGRWWTFDPRNNQRRIAHIVIGRGRDATDVPMATTFGAAQLTTMTVWADQVSG